MGDAAVGLERAQTALQYWTERSEETTRRLLSFRDNLAADALDEDVPNVDTAMAQAKELTLLEKEAEILGRYIQEAHRRIDRAQRDVWLAEASELDTQAARLEAEADERQPQTDKLLRELQEWEECPYGPAAPPTNSEAPGAPGSPRVTIRVQPKTNVLRVQASDLRRQADALREQAANTQEARQEREAVRRKAEQMLFQYEANRAEREALAEWVRGSDRAIRREWGHDPERREQLESVPVLSIGGRQLSIHDAIATLGYDPRNEEAEEAAFADEQHRLQAQDRAESERINRLATENNIDLDRVVKEKANA